MVETKFQKTGLWQKAFEEVAGDSAANQARMRLCVALLDCREKIKPIVGRIADVLPGLTVHDISHLDALWETADLIAGTDYPLNPLEAFVFGLAVLFHDSAMCWEAYERGQDGVRDSVEWKDAYAHECDVSSATDDEQRKAAADFAALRALHAHQASKLPEMAWQHPDNSQAMYLIENAQLRTDLGPLAGQIAASHHWDIDELSSKLGGQFNAPHTFPSEWHIDPVKVACLLRCADAAHINQARAPLFIYALVKRFGISLEHWRAQNHMMGPSLDMGDLTNSSILYTSSRFFEEPDATAWWIAHDAVQTIDQEIQASNALLKIRNRLHSPEFRIKKVKGADSVDELVKQLRVRGWMPCNAKPHVSNVESLVREFGGEKLYGIASVTDKIGIVLRELIQNGRDAIVARRTMEPDFDGGIQVRIIENSNAQWLYVDDNGIGMSQRVMTGPLLDFGKSYWKSSLVQAEFPGLRSSRFRSIGRFGIGFYSVFMISDEIEVSSRVWHCGLDSCNTLVFKNGVSLRPILRHGRPIDFSSQISTRIKIRLKPGLLDNMEEISIKPNFLGAHAFKCSFSEFLAALVIGLDVPVSVASPNLLQTEVQSGSPSAPQNAKEILSRISFSTKRQEADIDTYLENNHHRLRPIQQGDHIFGVAAISTYHASAQRLLGIFTIGGLPASLQSQYSDSFIGYIDHKPESARRSIASFEAPENVMRDWASDQLKILEESDVSDLERCVAGAYATGFGCDPIDFARVLISENGNQRFITYATLAKLAELQTVGVLKIPSLDFIDIHHSIRHIDDIVLVLPLTGSNSCNLKMNDELPEEAYSIIGCLRRAIIANCRTPKFELRRTAFQSTYGGTIDLLTITSLANI